MSRPMSAPRVRLRPSSAKDNTDEISYEDELVAKYLNELRLAPNQGKHIRSVTTIFLEITFLLTVLK